MVSRFHPVKYIGGQKFKFHATFGNKVQAQEVANRIRKTRKARIIRIKRGEHRVYKEIKGRK